MSKINKIRLSGTDYDIQDVSATSVVEVTQQQYDDLPASAKTDNILYIITDSTVDYVTSAQTQSAITQAVSGKVDTSTYTTYTAATATALNGKQDTLVSSSNIKTINNESLLGSGNIDIQGGGKAVSGGTNISVATGETADTINCTLPITGDTTTNAPKIKIGSDYSLLTSNSSVSPYGSTNAHSNILFGSDNKVFNSSGIGGEISYNFLLGRQNSAQGVGYVKPSSTYNMFCGFRNTTKSSYGFAFGISNTLSKGNQFAVGDYHTPKNDYETLFGRYNNSVSASTTFGDSGNTLFSVGNGTSTSARHNAFEIRQNGDIYISSGGTDIKLQDHLGGGGGSSYTAGDGIDITNDVISVTGKVDTSTYNAYTAATDTALASKQTTLTAGTGISIVDNVISATGGGGGVNVVQTTGTSTTDVMSQNAVTNIQQNLIVNYSNGSDGQGRTSLTAYKANGSGNDNLSIFATKINEKNIIVGGYSNRNGIPVGLSLVETSAITTSVSSSSTDSQVPSAKAVYDQLGGLKLVKLTQSEYDALSPNYDSNTLYVING